MATAKEKTAVVAPSPEEIEPAGAVVEKGADDRLLGEDDGLPNHTKLIPQANEAPVPDGVTHYKVLVGGISVPQPLGGEKGHIAEAVYLNEVVPAEKFGEDKGRIAYLLGMKMIAPVKG